MTADVPVFDPLRIAHTMGCPVGDAEDATRAADHDKFVTGFTFIRLQHEVPAGLARAIARRVDQAFFGGVAANTLSGLASLTVGAGNVQDIPAGTAPTNLDAFAQAQMLAGNVGARTSPASSPTPRPPWCWPTSRRPAARTSPCWC